MTRLIQLADIHFGREDPVAIEAASKLIPELGADGVVVCGDLTQSGKASEFRAAADWLKSLAQPFFTVPGNHDTPLLNLVSRVMAPFARYGRNFSQNIVSDQIGRLRVHGLNTSRGWQVRANWAEGAVNLDDLKELIAKDEEMWTESPSDLPACLVCHHPFRSPPGAPLQTRTRRGKRASGLLAGSRIKILLCGHVHTPTANVWEEGDDRYLCLTSGTLSTRLREVPPGFSVLDFQDGKLRVSEFSLKGQTFEVSRKRDWSFNNAELLVSSSV